MSSRKGFEVSVKEYAEQRGKTVQAVYQQMKRKENASKLNAHVFTRQVGNREVKFLDEEAVSILDQGSGSTPNIIIQDDLKAELEAKEAERKRWEAQAFMLQGKIDLLKEQLAEKDDKLLRLGEPQRQIDELKAQNAEISADNAKKDKFLEDERKTSQKLSDELTAIKSKWWYRLFAKKNKE